MPALSPRDRRALLLGGLVLVPALFWSAAGAPYVRATRAAVDRLAAERDLLERERDLIATARAWEIALEGGSQRLLDVAPRLFGGTAAAAGAALAEHLQRSARAARARLSRLQPVEAGSVGAGLVPVPLRVSGESDLEGVISLLYLLEAGEKLVRVDALRIQRARTTGNPSSKESVEVLSFELIATGFTLDARADTEDAARPPPVASPTREGP